MATRRWVVLLLIGSAAIILGSVAPAHDKHRRTETYKARLIGYNEVPAVSSPARGQFRALIDDEAGTVSYSLRYGALEGAVQQAHIHFGDRHTNGGISLFLCTNLGNGPAGTQLCPPAPAEISGTLTAAEVIGPAGQGIAPNELQEIIAAIRAGVAYANVHSDKFPAGEIRGQIGR